jgi:mono/diheme cytochrome c family protein
MTGSTRAAAASPVAVPPSLVRLQVVNPAGAAPYLRVDRQQMDIAMPNPGSPLISSRGAHDAIVWVLDPNARRSALLVGNNAPAPVLYAFDASSLRLLWRSAPGELATSGKYNQPLVARGQVIVGTDRIQAFGLGAVRAPADAGTGAGAGAVLSAWAPTPRDASTSAAAPLSATGPATLWRERCAVCHDQPQGNVPPRTLLSRRSPQRIAEALSHGVMQAQALGLGAAEIAALALWLTNEGAQ